MTIDIPDNQSPVAHVLGWFDTLPRELQSDVTFYVRTLAPAWVPDAVDADGLPVGIDGEIAAFRSRLQDATKEYFGSAGGALAVGRVIDFILDDRSTAEDWATTRRNSEEFIAFAAEKADATPSFLATLQRGIDQMPERAAQWIEAAAAWRTVQDGPLSLPAIRAWMREKAPRNR